MTTPANLYPGLNDIQDTLEQYPIETSKYITLLHEIDAKCVSLVPELNRRIDNFLSNGNVSRETTPALEFQRLKVLELAQINALFEELMPSLEEKMHVSSIMLETLERISSRLDLAYEVALRNGEIPEKLRLGVDNHPAMHLHNELMERIEQGGHGRHGNNNNNSAHASSSNTNSTAAATTTTTTATTSGNGVTGSGATEGKSSQALKSESRREAMAANKRAQQQTQQQQQEHQQQRQQVQNKHNETPLERPSSRKRSNNTGNGNGNGTATGEVSDTTKKRRKKNGNGNNGTVATASAVATTATTNASSNTINNKGNSNSNNAATSEETTTHGKQRTNEYGEPLYCYCNQVAYGEMVGCDGENCELEWFHLPCIGLETLPKGKWYCRSCKKKLKS